MKKLIFILSLYSTILFAQNVTDCPFQARKYVHYDGRIESSTSFIPTIYNQFIQNNPNYYRTNNQLGSAAKGTCFYKTSIHNQNKIKKPFVFVEGISFEKIGANINTYTMAEYFRQGYYPDPHPYEYECVESYNSAPQYLNEQVGYSTFNWATLVTGIDAEGYYSGDPLKVEKSPELLNQLCCAGYDICFVDFESGEAYIESNGEVLYSLLVKLHDTLVANNSTEKMVVCGASMGGLVARYAINKLEAEGHTDWVEKFISFDSPQMGANIPLGVQYTLKHLKGLNAELETKYNKLVCPSASQLVNYSCLETNFGSPIVYTVPSPSIERSVFLNNPYMGWPQHCTKIAISNGSRMGYTQSSNHQPGDKVLDIDGWLNLDLNALPQNDNNYQKIFDFDPPYCLLSHFPLLWALGITQQSVRVKNTMALDLAPGSYRTDLKDIESQLPDFITGTLGQVESACNLGWIDNSDNNDKLCFIPFVSSVGAVDYDLILNNPPNFTNGFINLTFNGNQRFEDYSHNYSYFDIAYAPVNNQSHVEITDENISWLMYELMNMPPTIVHENRNIIPYTYEASISISAGNNIFNNPICNTSYSGSNNPCGDAYVGTGRTVYYKAGQFVDLEPGFYVENNAVFQAEIISVPSCYSNGRTSAPSNNEEAGNSTISNEFESKRNGNVKEELEMAGKFIQLFPNPAHQYCDIKSSDIIEQVSIHSLVGNHINTQQVNERNFRLFTTELADGVYLINIKTSNTTVIKKLIVKHE